MSIFDKFKKKEEREESQEISESVIVSTPVEAEKIDLVEMNHYMLTEIRKQDLNNCCQAVSLTQLAALCPMANEAVNNIKTITKQNPKSSQLLYRVTNLKKNDVLKPIKGGKGNWGAIKKADGTSTMAKLKPVTSPNSSVPLNPSMLMMSVALSGIESQLGEIKELNTQIYSFLEHDKQAEIESDLEILTRSMNDFKFNLESENYLLNNHKQVMDIKRTANKNILFYQKELEASLAKSKLFTTSNSMNAIMEEMQKKFNYYRLSLYLYSFSTFLEVLLLKNYDTNFLLSKQEELNSLDITYATIFHTALNYVKQNANKALESGVLSGLGSAGKAIGNLAEKVKAKNVDTWLNEKGDSLKQNSETFKENFTEKFNDYQESHVALFKEQIKRLDDICNKTQEMYFDDDNLYLLT